MSEHEEEEEDHSVMVVYRDDRDVERLPDDATREEARRWQGWVFAETGNAVGNPRHSCVSHRCFDVKGRIRRLHPTRPIYGCTVSGRVHWCHGSALPSSPASTTARRRNPECFRGAYYSADGAVRCSWSSLVIVEQPMLLANKEEFTHEAEVNNANDLNTRIINENIMNMDMDTGRAACKRSRPSEPTRDGASGGPVETDSSEEPRTKAPKRGRRRAVPDASGGPSPSPPPPQQSGGAKRRTETNTNGDDGAPTLTENGRAIVKQAIQDILYSPHVKATLGKHNTAVPDALGPEHQMPGERSAVVTTDQSRNDAAYLSLVHYVCAKAYRRKKGALNKNRLRSVSVAALYAVSSGVNQEGMTVIPQNTHISRALPSEADLKWYGKKQGKIKEYLERRATPVNAIYKFTINDTRTVRAVLQEMTKQEIRQAMNVSGE